MSIVLKKGKKDLISIPSPLMANVLQLKRYNAMKHNIIKRNTTTRLNKIISKYNRANIKKNQFQMMRL